jgi:TorA maturation chaperone TorD
MDDDAALLAAFREAASADLDFLARLHDREPDAALLKQLRDSNFPAGCLELALDSPDASGAAAGLHQVMQSLPSPPPDELLNELAADYAAIYLTHAHRASPYESVWLDDENLVCQDAMFEVRAWYQRHQLAAPNWRERADDHLVFQLQFVAHLLREGLESEAATFLDEHLLRWLGDFARRVATHSHTDFFAGVAVLTHAHLESLRDLLARILDEPRPSAEEIQARLNTLRQELPPPSQGAGCGPGW